MQRIARIGQALIATSLCLCPLSNGVRAQNSPEPHLVALPGSDATNILKYAVPRTMANRGAAANFTYSIAYRNRNFTPAGKLLADYAATYDVVVLAGMPYRRLVEESGHPLSAHAAQLERQRYDQTFLERSRLSPDEKKAYLRRLWNVDMPLPFLATLFTNTVVGEDSVAGRDAIMVECRPRTGVIPADEEQRRALHKQLKLWIDREDLVVSRIEARLVADDASMRAGTTARIEFTRKDGIWLQSGSDVHFQALSGGEVIDGETQEVYSGFRRFHADVRLVDAGDLSSEANPAQ